MNEKIIIENAHECDIRGMETAVRIIITTIAHWWHGLIDEMHYLLSIPIVNKCNNISGEKRTDGRHWHLTIGTRVLIINNNFLKIIIIIILLIIANALY